MALPEQNTTLTIGELRSVTAEKLACREKPTDNAGLLDVKLHYAKSPEGNPWFVNNALVTWTGEETGFFVSLTMTTSITDYLKAGLNKVRARTISNLSIDELTQLRDLVNDPGSVIDIANVADQAMYLSVEGKLKEIVKDQLHRKIAANTTSDSKETK